MTNPLNVSQTNIQQQSRQSTIPQGNLSQNQPLNTSALSSAQGTANQIRDVSYYNPPADTHMSSSDYSKSPDDKIVPR